MGYDIRLEEYEIGGMTYTCRSCGLDNDGDFIILLHGFPETSYMWTELLPQLAQKGYRCFAPDQRGYSVGARPLDEDAYNIAILAADVIAFADHFGAERFHLIGHDWGSNVCYATVATYPDRVICSSHLSTYYPAENTRIMSENLKQRSMSNYIFEFLEEDSIDNLYADNSAKIKKEYWFEMPQPHIDEYMKIFGTKEGILGPVNWYRAKYRWLTSDKHQPNTLPHGDVDLPILCIRGMRDPYQGPMGFESMHKYMKGFYLYNQIDAGHWLMQNNADYVIPMVLQHLERFAVKKG